MTDRLQETHKQSRRTFVKNAATVVTGVAAAGAANAALANAPMPSNGLAAGNPSAPQPRSADKKKAEAGEKTASHIVLFMHPPSTLSYRELLKPNPAVEENWRKVISAKARDEGTVVCIVQGGKGDKELVDTAKRHFGDRCVVDPSDNSDETLILLARDLERTFRGRGNHGEWNHYELWSSNSARRWTEGFKKRLAQNGYAYDPKTVTMETFGNWTGCHHKYSNFMAKYMGLTKPAVIHAEPSLSTLKGFPHKVVEYLECIPMDRHVVLVLFRREDGCPMAQYWDGLRAVWEPPHTATVTDYPKRVELYTLPTNSLIPVSGATRKLRHGFVADVGDGTHSAYTTIVGQLNKDADIREFRDALAGATITPRDDKRDVYYSIET
jgi:hypothetical protein